MNDDADLIPDADPQTDAEAAAKAAYDVLAAEIAGAHGVGGNVRLRVIGTPDVALGALRRAPKILGRGALGQPDLYLTLSSIRRNSNAKGAWIGRFKELKDRAGVEKLFGYGLYVREEERPALEDGVYYVDDLLGSAVVTDAGRSLGTLTEILNTPANDVYVTDAGAMIPAVPAFLVDVDIASKRITVTDVPGLLDEDDQPSDEPVRDQPPPPPWPGGGQE